MRLCFFLIASLLAGLSANAQDTAIPAWQAQMEQKLRRNVTFEFKDATLDEAVAFIGQLSKVTVVLQPDIKTPAITLSVTNVSIKNALDKILAQSGLEYAYVDEALFIFEKGKFPKAEAPSAPPLSAEAEKKFDTSLSLLRDSDFNIRENASKAIAALGRDASLKLEAALRIETDAEARERLTRILSSYAQPTLNDVSPEATRLLDSYSHRITFTFVEIPLEDAVLFTGQFIHNPKFACDTNVTNLPLTLRVNDMPMGLALRWIARVSGARIVADGDALKFEEAPAKK
jgi:type II secretory pathway component GspD/PulD (secretin)